MAFLHRKLLQYPNNETVPCNGFCDPTCTNFEDCYSYPDPEWSPPPAPQFSVAPPSFHVSPIVIFAVILLGVVFLLVTYYAVVVKHCSSWTRCLTRNNPDPNAPNSDAPDNQEAVDLFHDMNGQDPVVDHPIWLISTVGLHQSVINSILAIKYKKGDGIIEGTDCSVCLSEFHEGETLRLLPKCNHAFHIDCIDTWLRSHTNCPLCRAGIVVNSGRPSLASSAEPSFGHSRRAELARVDDHDLSDMEIGVTQTGNSSGVGSEDRGDTGDDIVVEISSSSNDQIKAENSNVNEDSMQQVRRSFSMDFSRGSNSRNVGNPNPQGNTNSSSVRLTGSFSYWRRQPATSGGTPPPMKRSYSWSERVFWSTRNQIHNSDLSP